MFFLIIFSALMQTQACGVGWGGTRFMFLRTRRHSNLIIFPALMQTQAFLTQALLFHHPLAVGWGGVGQ